MMTTRTTKRVSRLVIEMNRNAIIWFGHVISLLVGGYTIAWSIDAVVDKDIHLVLAFSMAFLVWYELTVRVGQRLQV